MKTIEVLNQAQLDCVPDDFEGIIIVKGNVILSRNRGSAHVEAWESAHVEARGSAHVVACESAHVVAWGSAHVEAWESAHVEARESAHVVARGSAHVEAGKWNSVQKMIGHTGNISGGVVVVQPELKTPEDWCAYYGVTVVDGVAILYKAVRDDYQSAHGFLYMPGSSPECADWDGGRNECGGGLHFCASPDMAFTFDESSTRFLACPVALADMRAPQKGDSYPYKIKASRICGPIVEVDKYGESISSEART